MDDKKDIFKIIEEYPNKQDVNPAVINDAKALAEELYGVGKVKNNRRNKTVLKMFFASFASCIVFVLIFFPIYLNSTKEVSRYYSADQLQSKKVENMENFVAINNLNILYFNADQATSKDVAYYIQETNELVYLTQSTVIISENGFDLIELGIVMSSHSFEKFAAYLDLNNEILSGNIKVFYSEDKNLDEKTIIKAKFNYNNVNYYMNIATTNKTGKLDSYVKMLQS